MKTAIRNDATADMVLSATGMSFGIISAKGLKDIGMTSLGIAGTVPPSISYSSIE